MHTIRAATSWTGLYLPKRYPQAKDEEPHAWAPAGRANHEEAATFVQTQPRCKPDGMVYMDGSRDKVPTAGLVTGAGVYRSMSTAHLGLTVCPNEQGMLYTVNRAEMVATL
jgi:hypothetical protein